MNVWWIIGAIYAVAVVLVVLNLWIRGKNKTPRPERENQEEIEYLQKCKEKHRK